MAAISKEENNPLQAISYQAERLRMVEESATLKSEEFTVKIELASLYLENRLGVPFQTEIEKLETMATSKDEEKAVQELKRRWGEVKEVDHDATMQVDLKGKS